MPNVWNLRGDLQVPGPQGETGPAGADGSAGVSGIGIPINALPLNPGPVAFEVGRYYDGARTGSGAAATRTLATNTVYYMPFYAPMDITIDRLAIRVGGTTASQGKFAIYNSGTNGLPYSRLTSTSAVSYVSPGMEATVTYTLKAGIQYWFAFHASASIASVECFEMLSSPNFGFATSGVGNVSRATSITTSSTFSSGPVALVSSVTYEILDDSPVSIRARVASFDPSTSVSGTSFTWKGVYSSGTVYNKNDVVRWTDGNTYIRIISQSSSGTDPTNTSYWQLFVLKGETGATGPTGPAGNDGVGGITFLPYGLMAWRGDFDWGMTYEPFQVVRYNNGLYIVADGNYPSGQAPDNGFPWQLMVQGM